MSTAPNFGGFDAFTGDMRPANGGVLVRFYSALKKDDAASEAEGRPVWKDVDYIKKMTPGDQYNVVDRPVRDSDKEEFPTAWAAYQRGLTEKHEGVALEEWPGCSRSQVEDLKYQGVFTMEELSRTSDKDAAAWGVEPLRQRARDYLSRGSMDDDRARLREVMAAKDGELEQLRQQLADITQSQRDEKKKGKG